MRTSRIKQHGDSAVGQADDRRSKRTREAGYVLALTALLMTGMIAFTALAVDLGAWFARAATLQRTADAASLAAVTYMPNLTRVNQEVDTILLRNGIDMDDATDNIDVLIQPIGNARVRVVITDNEADQFFSGLFTNDVVIERGATAEFIKPVPMGSPTNYLGTGRMFGDAGEPPDDDFWVSVSGYCARREHGDRMTPRTDSNNNNAPGDMTFRGCNNLGTASSSTMGANPEWRSGGYFYAVELDDGDDNAGEPWPFNPIVEVYDAPHCEEAGTQAGDSGPNGADSAMWGSSFGGRSGQRQYTYTLRSNDSPFNPAAATPIGTPLTVGPNSCGTYAGQWRPVVVGGIPNATEGVYYLQINPVTPTDTAGENSQEGQNQLSIRARNPASSTSDSVWPCTSDPTTATSGAEYDVHCPKVYGLTHLGVYVNAAGSTARPYLADIGSEHAGKTVQLEIFDAAEGMQSLQILKPDAGNPPYTSTDFVNFAFEIGCQNGSYESEGDSCGSEGDPNPAGADNGRGPFLNRTIIDVSGTVAWANKPYTVRHSQDTRFSDNLMRIQFTLPTLADNPTWYGGNTWFRIYYVAPGGTAVGDRTTWSVQIKGDPVRLVE